MNRCCKRLLIVGAGSIGERQLRCFQSTGRVAVALCEPDPRRRQSVADRYGVPDVFPDLQTALGRQFDAAVICTPAHLHVPLAILLAQAGAHLLIEKPLSTSLDQIGRLRSLLQQAGLVAAVGYMYRAHPVLQEMKQAIDQGRFGRPLQVIGRAGQHFPTYRPAYRETYYADRATGGGAIQDALTHLLNVGQWLAGPVQRLAADAEHLSLPGVEVEDTVHVLTRQDGVMGCYGLNQHQAPKQFGLDVVCEAGVAQFQLEHHRWRWMTEPGGDWRDQQHPPLPLDAMYTAQAQRFLDAIPGAAPPYCSLDEGVHCLKVNLAVLQSVETGQWQTID